MTVDETMKKNRDGTIEGPENTGTVTALGLAPFEEASSILLDDFSFASPTMLDELDIRSEVIYIDELFGSATEEEDGKNNNGEPGPGEGAEESGEETDADLTDADGGNEIGAVPTEGEVKPATGEPETVPPPSRPVFAFVCECAVDATAFTDEHGRMRNHPQVHVFTVPCAGMVKPSWIEHAMDGDASGVMVIACEPGSCKHRTGSCILGARWTGERRPMLKSRIDRSRVRLIYQHPASVDDLMTKIEGFLRELGWMDNNIKPYEIPEPEDAESVIEDPE